MRSVLITGGAGFIGSHLTDRLLEAGWDVTAIDNFDPFYAPEIKRGNIAVHLNHPHYRLVESDIRDATRLRTALTGEYDAVVHLAAKAGVRPSLENPVEYQSVNVCGTQAMLDLARVWHTPHFVFASSSSVYGTNPDVPWREDDPHLQPISPYAASKIAGEALGRVYSHLYDMRFIALRFFTVYGPRQRPDLAIHSFTSSILRQKTITLYGNGRSSRDYTFVGDIIDGVCAALEYRSSPFEIFNLGNCRTIALEDLIHAIEKALGAHARIQFLGDQPGDVPRTCADIDKARRMLGYNPHTYLHEGLQRFAADFLAGRDAVLQTIPA
jgi:UDP-glucuronate 4-epimerase